MFKQRIKFNPVVLISLLLFSISVLIVVFSTDVSPEKDLTALENRLLWIFGLVSSMIASFLITRQSTQKVALDMIKPHAKSAFRRLLWLYGSLSRLSILIHETRKNDSMNDNELVQIIEALITEQIATAGDSLEDWRDIIPEQIEEVEESIKKRRV